MKRYCLITTCVLTLVACSGEQPPGSISVEGPASLSVSEGKEVSFDLKNVGGQAVDWTLDVRNGADNPKPEDWFTLSEKEGRLEPDSETTLVLTLIEDLPDGRYTAELNVLYRNGDRDETTTFEVLGVIGEEDDTGGATITGSVTTDNKLISVVPEDTGGPSQRAKAPIYTGARPDYAPGQLLIQYAEPGLNAQAAGDSAEPWVSVQRNVQTQYGLRALEKSTPDQLQRVATGSQDVLELAAELSADPRISYAEPDYYLHTTALPNDEFIQGQWWLASAGVPVAWGTETGDSSEVVVAVVDSGFDLEHPELKGRFLDGIDFCSEVDFRNEACSGADNDPSYAQPSNTHGTHVAGIVGASAGNGQGIAGVAHGSGVKLLPVKIFDDSGEVAQISNFVNGVRWAAGLEVTVNGTTYQNPEPADIINLSLGGFFESQAVEEAVSEARAAGAVVLAASGNNGVDQIISPAAADGVIAVGAVNPNFRRSCFSNYGTGADFGPGKLDLVVAGGEGAPTEDDDIKKTSPNCNPEPANVYSTFPEGSYGNLAGTSMATPLASGIAALALAQQPELNAELLEAKLLESTYFDPSYMSEEEYGAGILRADYALNLPGPGAEVTVSTSKNGEDYIDTVKLNLLGGSATYTLKGLAAGRYRIKGVTGGSGAVLEGRADLSVNAGKTKRLDIALSAQQNAAEDVPETP